MLTELERLPDGLLACEARDLHTVLAGPTLIHLEGVERRPLYVCVLLHGNETTGWDAVRSLLQRTVSRGERLPRALSLLVGNVEAARHGLRHLDTQPDFNRVWNGGERAAHAMAARVLEIMRAREPVACVDVHNNSGANPRYACVNRLDPAWIRLGALFEHKVVYSVRPDTTQTMAFSRLCPSVILECGRPASPGSLEHATAFLETCLALDPAHLAERTPPEVELLRSVAIARVPETVTLSFDSAGADLRLLDHIDNLNFHELPPGTSIGWVRDNGIPLEVRDDAGADVGDLYFAVRDGELVTRASFIPAMFTPDERIIRQDCLCYVMERMEPRTQAGDRRPEGR